MAQGFNYYRCFAVVWAIALVVFMAIRATTRSETTAASASTMPLVRSDDVSNNDNGDDEKKVHNNVVKVFILAGQSNMVGMGSIEHLRELIHNATDNNECDKDEYCEALWNVETNRFKYRNDVFMKYEKKQGRLTVGHGFAWPRRFGPEVGFGWVMGDELMASSIATSSSTGSSAGKKEYTYIIKTAWHGKSLAVDFRPPSSGKGDYPDVEPSKYGSKYRDMVTEIQEGLDQMAEVVPGYDANDTNWSYELAGFVWFQGFNDAIIMPFVKEYGFNLANFIRDVRKELDTPNLPFVVGELGMQGLHYNGQGAHRVQLFRAAQENVTLLPEFKDSSKFVRTAPYAVRKGGKDYEGNYHYRGRADTYFHIGKAFGRAMLELI